MRLHGLIVACVAVATSMPCDADPTTGPLRAVPFNDVRIDDAFWSPRIETNRTVTVPYCFDKCAETGRLGNFARAAGDEAGGFEGIYFNDSDVYKVIEGAAYALAAHPDPALDEFLDDLIATMARAQRPDGYLNTYYTLAEPDRRWTDIKVRHELYCAGHLFEAAVAHYRATGKRTLLDVALRFADLIDTEFGPGRRTHPPGHQEIEIGLVRLYEVTGERRYLDLARFFIDQRGRANGRELYGSYSQDHVPVTEQDTPVGHAVRAMYLYCGMADVAAHMPDTGYLPALERIWRSEVERKIYITGGIGSTRHGEAFGADYVLPNDTAYNETCAAIGNAMWNHRLALVHADARYADVLERVLYNGLLSGVSRSGDRFFYPNPLSCAGDYHRSPWFDCSCCPVNVVRFIPSVSGYLYAHDDDAVTVNLYVQSTATVHLDGGDVVLRQRTEYPWDGRVEVHVEASRDKPWQLRLRVPGWARGRPMPSDLYEDVDPPVAAVAIRVNGNYVDVVETSSGYIELLGNWRAGDVVTMDLPMEVRRVRSHDAVEANRGRIALERGPLVYCVEACDVDGVDMRHLWVPASMPLRAERRPELLGGITVLQGTARARQGNEVIAVPFTAVPYHLWDHREAGAMAVWLPESPETVPPVPEPTIASRGRVTASHCGVHDSLAAVNDQVTPASSNDHSIPRHTWWDHRGTAEWIAVEFVEPRWIDAVDVYWFDDTGRGECRVPGGWRVRYHDGTEWRDVRRPQQDPIALDCSNATTFAPVRAHGVRIDVDLQAGFSGGVLELTVREAPKE